MSRHARDLGDACFTRSIEHTPKLQLRHKSSQLQECCAMLNNFNLSSDHCANNHAFVDSLQAMLCSMTIIGALLDTPSTAKADIAVCRQFSSNLVLLPFGASGSPFAAPQHHAWLQQAAQTASWLLSVRWTASP